MVFQVGDKVSGGFDSGVEGFFLRYNSTTGYVTLLKRDYAFLGKYLETGNLVEEGSSYTLTVPLSSLTKVENFEYRG